MTDFEQLKTELESLGWSGRQGAGDHTKFTKDGVPHTISIAKSVSSGNRSYKNLLAEIRRWEPASTLGRTAKSKAHLSTEELIRNVSRLSEGQKAYSQRKKYIYVDAEVRYTMPEGGDYSLLDSPSSVMGMKYVVKGILHGGENRLYVTDPSDVIVISHDDTGEIRVCPDDIESYELVTCDACGKKVPASHLYQEYPDFFEEDEPLCQSCMKKKEKVNVIMAKLASLPPLTTHEEKKLPHPKMNECMSYMNSHNKDDVRLICLPDEELDELLRKLDEAIEEAEEIKAKALLKPSKPARTKKPNVFDSFNRYKEDCALSLGCKVSELSQLSYRLNPKCGSSIIVTDSSRDRNSYRLSILIYYMYDLLTRLGEVFPGKTAFVELCYPAIGFDQVICEDDNIGTVRDIIAGKDGGKEADSLMAFMDGTAACKLQEIRDRISDTDLNGHEYELSVVCNPSFEKGFVFDYLIYVHCDRDKYTEKDLFKKCTHDFENHLNSKLFCVFADREDRVLEKSEFPDYPEGCFTPPSEPSDDEILDGLCDFVQREMESSGLSCREITDRLMKGFSREGECPEFPELEPLLPTPLPEMPEDPVAFEDTGAEDIIPSDMEEKPAPAPFMSKGMAPFTKYLEAYVTEHNYLKMKSYCSSKGCSTSQFIDYAIGLFFDKLETGQLSGDKDKVHDDMFEIMEMLRELAHRGVLMENVQIPVTFMQPVDFDKL